MKLLPRNTATAVEALRPIIVEAILNWERSRENAKAAKKPRAKKVKESKNETAVP